MPFLEVRLSIALPEEPILDQPRPKLNPVLRFLVEVIQTVILALLLYFLIDSVVARVRVENISMKPTLQPGEFLLVNKLAYRFGPIGRGDIVVFHHSEQEDYIKRIIGIPGDVVKVAGGRVSVNGQPLRELYISGPPSYEGEWVVPEDSFYVLGDNRNQSSDSHQWGFVPGKSVVGKAIVIYWPLNRFEIINQHVVFASP
jgi:signal peptidase I